MQRWDATTMFCVGKKLFAKVHRRKRLVHHNHEIHILARQQNDWLVQGVQNLLDGAYTPRHLKRTYFKDEVIDQLHLTDRVMQHLLLKQLKPTFQHVMSKHCYHLHGPTGVKYATQKLRQALQDNKPSYVIRADIKSFYKSIPQYKLVRDIKKYYDDSKVQHMLENIITNPIDTPKGCVNPSTGIALRGPLSQFFSALYLKPLDDALGKMDITYIRYQDDLIALCKTKRQLNRCRRRMMEILHERQLTLSRKKSRIGSIESGFHFLGVDYPPTRIEDNTNIMPVDDGSKTKNDAAHILPISGGG